MLSSHVPSPTHMCSNIPQKASEDEGCKSLGITSTPDETPLTHKNEHIYSSEEPKQESINI